MGVGAVSELVPRGHGADLMASRILDASMEQLMAFGPRHFSVEEVARRAGVNRVTIYRRFAGKDELLRGVILREGQRILTVVDQAVSGLDSPQAQIVEGFATVVTLLRRHPLLARMLESEPETLAGLIVTHGAAVVAVAREYLAGHVRLAQRAGRLGALDAAVVAELVVRLSLSLVVMPESCIALDTADEARAFARNYLVPALSPKAPR